MSETKREPFVNKNNLDPTPSSPALPAHKIFILILKMNGYTEFYLVN